MANTKPEAPRPAQQDATSSAKPIARFGFESVSAAIFTESVKTKGGRTVDVYNVSLRRSYQNAEGDWANTHTLRRADLLPAGLALMKCYEFINDANSAGDESQQ